MFHFIINIYFLLVYTGIAEIEPEPNCSFTFISVIVKLNEAKRSLSATVKITIGVLNE